MKSRYLILFLSVVLALALAVPALGGPTNPIASISASVKQTANKALKKAKAAQKTANSALNTANSAQTTANSAQSAAKAAQSTATSAQTAANSAQATANAAKTAAAAAQATANSKFGETFTEFGEGSGTSTTSGFDLVSCPTGSEVTGGGYETSGTGDNEVVPIYTASYGDAWLASLARIPGQADSWSVRAIVTCAAP
jgi:membrane protein involved in colicin uptake